MPRNLNKEDAARIASAVTAGEARRRKLAEAVRRRELLLMLKAILICGVVFAAIVILSVYFIKP